MEGFTVTEIPVTNNPRLHGESKYGVWNRLFKSFRDLLAIRWMKSRLLGYRVAVELDRSGERDAAAAGVDQRGCVRISTTLQRPDASRGPIGIVLTETTRRSANQD